MQGPSNLPSLAARSTTNVRSTPSDVPFGKMVSIGATAEKWSSRKYPPVAVPRRMPATFLAMPAEPDDARITGATRSLSRRLLALNVRQDA